MTVSTYQPSNSIGSSLPIEFLMPESYETARELITRRETLTANILNLKESAQYETRELLSAQQWFSTATGIVKPRYGYRIVVNFGALPNNATKTVNHGLTIDANTIFTRIYGTATNPNTLFIPIPYINTGTPGDSVELFVDATNVSIKTTTNRTAFTITYVVLEYLKF